MIDIKEVKNIIRANIELNDYTVKSQEEKEAAKYALRTVLHKIAAREKEGLIKDLEERLEEFVTEDGLIPMGDVNRVCRIVISDAIDPLI